MACQAMHGPILTSRAYPQTSKREENGKKSPKDERLVKFIMMSTHVCTLSHSALITHYMHVYRVLLLIANGGNFTTSHVDQPSHCIPNIPLHFRILTCNVRLISPGYVLCSCYWYNSTCPTLPPPQSFKVTLCMQCVVKAISKKNWLN